MRDKQHKNTQADGSALTSSPVIGPADSFLQVDMSGCSSNYAEGRCPCNYYMAGLGNNPVQVYRTGRDLHWVKFTFETGFELPSSCLNLPCYALNRNRNILDFMSWHQIDLGAQDLNGIQRPKHFSKSSWK